MFIEPTHLTANSVIQADVTVIGAGPAGIVAALELERHGLTVSLVESGGLKPSESAQKLGYSDWFDPRRHAPMDLCTRRQLGGASVIWGGRCLPYDPVDFDEREYVPHSKWPISYNELTPYFQSASTYCLTGSPNFSMHEIEEIAQKTITPVLADEEILTSTLERWSLPTNFGKEYANKLRQSQRIRVYFGLTCTRIDTNPSGNRVDNVLAQTLDRTSVRFRSRFVVAACGGLDTTRLLLASNQQYLGGIGNHSDQLGRYYMGHISGKIARVRLKGDPRRTVFGYHRDRDGVYIRPRFSFSREFLHRKRLTNIVAWLANPLIGDPAHRNGVLSFAYLALASPLGKHFASEAIRRAATASAPHGCVGQHIRNMVSQPFRTLSFIATFGYRRFLAWRRVPGFFQYAASNEYDLHYHGEQVPNYESRVSLSPTTDELGMPRLHIDLRFSQQDVDSVRRAHEYIDEYLRRRNAGSLIYHTDDLERDIWDQAADGYHQVGTTRISRDSSGGVVDEHCRVHGIDNLYIASSSVFVTSGQANSTFMIVVFALRIADHIHSHFTRRDLPAMGQVQPTGEASSAR